MSRTQSWVLELCLLCNNEQLYKVRTSGWIITSQAFYATLITKWNDFIGTGLRLHTFPGNLFFFLFWWGYSLWHVEQVSVEETCLKLCVCVFIFIFLMLLLLFHWACSVDMPNTVKNSKNYSQLMQTTCFDTTFNVNHFIKSSVTF